MITDVLMQNMHASYLQLFQFSVCYAAMDDTYVAYDSNEYKRLLPDFWAMLIAFLTDQVDFLCTDFTQSITGHPYSNMA